MSKIAKVYAQLLANPRQTISFREFEQLLRAFGFEHVRTKGSHRLYVHATVPRPLPVQPTGKDAKHYQVNELLGLIEVYALSIEA